MPPVKRSKHDAISFNAEEEVVPDSTMIWQTRSSKEVSVVLTVNNKSKWNDGLHSSEML